MKIGILSMQKVMNYGSFLQGFALKKTIEGLGHQCEFVDIERGHVFPELKLTLGFVLHKCIERFCKWDAWSYVYYTHKFRKHFKKEFFPLLGVDVHTIDHFDVVVIGSDEVFNFAQRVPWGFSLQLYGQVANADKVISYAGSFGHTTIEDIKHFNVQKKITSAMASMAAISVRDLNSFCIVKELLGIEASMNIDPVLLFDYTSYIKHANRKNYIVIYSYPDRIKKREEIDAIRRFAKKYNKRLISIGFYFPWCDETVVPDPFEVLGYMQGADYIITDTFHGSVMSLKFNRPFVTLIRNTNRQKMTSLLAQFHLEGQIADDASQLEKKLFQKIDYTLVNEILQKNKEQSLNYLKSNL